MRCWMQGSGIESTTFVGPLAPELQRETVNVHTRVVPEQQQS